MTIAQQFAAEAHAMTFADLPSDVVDHVKRCVLDTVGVGIGGYRGGSSQVLLSVVDEMPAARESTVFVSGTRTSCLLAALVNGAMVREAEREHASGREVITTVALAYELLNRFSYAMGGNIPIAELGWKHEFRSPYVMALVAGRLLGLDVEQMANALAVAGSFFVPLGILDHGEEQLNMARNLRFPYGAYSGVLAALFARKGFKGPLRIFEGRHGFAESVARGGIDLAKLTERRNDWTIRSTWLKQYAAEGRIHGPIEATLEIVTEHDIAADDVAEVNVRIIPFAHPRTANSATRRHPETKYTADQSTFYCVAVAILDRAVGPAQFADDKLRDPRVHALTEKIAIVPGPELVDYIAPGTVEIVTTSGQRFRREVRHPKGHPARPLSDLEVETKFRSMARDFMDDRRMSDIIDTVRGLDRLDDISALATLLAAQN